MNTMVHDDRGEYAPTALQPAPGSGAPPAQLPGETSNLPEEVQPTSSPAIERVNMVLSRVSLDVLDATSARILKNTGSHVNRSQLVRAMVEALGEARLVFVGCRTEADVKTVCLQIYRDASRVVARMRTEAAKR